MWRHRLNQNSNQSNVETQISRVDVKQATNVNLEYTLYYFTRMLVQEGIIHPIVSDSALTWFIRYIYT